MGGNNDWNIANASQWYALAPSSLDRATVEEERGCCGAPSLPPFLPPHCHCFLKGSDVKPCGERVVKSEIPLAYHRGEKGNLTN